MGRPTYKKKNTKYCWVSFSLPEDLHNYMRKTVAEKHPYTQAEFMIEAVKSYKRSRK